MLTRRRQVLIAVAALALLAGAGLAGTWWYALGEERRSGRLVSRALAARTGIPITIERARVGATTLVFHGVHLPPGPHWTGDVRVRELRVEGGVMPIVFPRGRPVVVVAVAPSITLAESREPVRPPSADALEAVRRYVMQVIEWPAPLSLRIEGGELRAGRDDFAFDLAAEKTLAGALGITVNVSPAEGGPALTLRVAGRRQGDRIVVRVGIESQPSRLGAFWPPALPAFARATIEADGALQAGGAIELAGRLRAERRADEPALTAEFGGGYDAAAATLRLARLAADWGPDVSVRGSGRVDMKEAFHLALELAGAADGIGVAATLDYAAGTGAASADVRLEDLDAARLFARAGLGRPPTEMKARRLRTTLSGTLEAERILVRGDASLDNMQLPAVLPDTRVEAVAKIDVTLARVGSGFALARVGPSSVTLTHKAAPVIVAAAYSREATAWPLAVVANLDLRQMPSLPALPTDLDGRATFTGDLDLRGEDGPRFAGRMTADIPRAEISIRRPVVATRVRLDVPVYHGTPAAPVPGILTAERIEAFGFALERLESAARFAEGALRLADIRYRHYGGGGRGFIEAAVDRRAVPLKARVEGEHIDLAALAREYGLTVARLDGKVNYLLVLQYSAARGFNGAGQVNSEGDGGEIGIDAIEKLLSSAVVQSESTGLLRQFLENLRVFRYSSLEGEVRVTRDGGDVSLSIYGKKRLGIFPPAIKAINFNNVPIALLARLFARKEAS